MTFTPKNWTEFQHYKDRSPVWIKLHRSLLDNYDYARLPLASRALAPMLWLLASEYEHGVISASPAEIAFRLRMSEDELSAALKPLVDGGFFSADSVSLAHCKRDACLERETEGEVEKEKKIDDRSISKPRLNHWPSDFEDQFWGAYPKRVDKQAAIKALRRIWKGDQVGWPLLLAAVKAHAASMKDTDRKFIKSPEVWLNKGCWDDELQASEPAPVEERGIHVMRESPEWELHAMRYRAAHGHDPPTDKTGGWRFYPEQSGAAA